MPSATSNFLRQRPWLPPLPRVNIWLESEFLAVLQERGLVGSIDTAEALLRYVRSQDLADDYKIVLPTLESITRGNYRDHDDRFIVRAKCLPPLKKTLKVAETVQGRDGLGSFEHVLDRVPDADVPTLRLILQCNRFVWSAEIGSRSWFAFANRTSAARNCAAKIFGVVSSCPVDILSNLIANGLKSRNPVFAYPDAAVLKAWIEQSTDFDIESSKAFFTGDAEGPAGLEVELDNALSSKPRSVYSDAAALLAARGVGRSTIDKLLYASPLVFIDKSQDPYRFTYVADLTRDAFDGNDRYEIFRERLRRLEDLGTDIGSATTARREQPILREWLFGDENKAECAMCHRRFSTTTLVAAHKRKRARCSEAARLDPYIVFPLCLFGCDYLYEPGYVTVTNGRFVDGKPAAGTEADIVRSFVDTALDPQWLQGPASYFDHLAP